MPPCARVDWQEAFRDAPPRRELAFRRKQDDRNFLVRLPLGLKHGKILLPKGFIQGQKLQETLRQLTLPFSNSTDFDLLPTPFRAVATDLVTGKAVLLDKGDLSIAMRASISAPGRVCAGRNSGPAAGRRRSGGEPAHRRGAANARGHPDRLRRELSACSRARRSIRPCRFPIRCWRFWCARMRTGRGPPWAPRTYLIEPDLGTTSSADFTAALATIGAGENAARGVLGKLAELARRRSAYAIMWCAAPRANPDCRRSNSCASMKSPSAMKRPSWRRCSRSSASRWTWMRSARASPSSTASAISRPWITRW